MKNKIYISKDPLWYKDAIIYQIHVRSFFDSNADGIGDLQGLINKLDYINFLGANTIWLLPFYPSPLKDDGYDIADYTAINPIYGNLADFKKLLYEAHKRDLNIMTELVLNHTSNEHPWFKKARNSPPNSKWRNFYVWSDTTERNKDARIIFKDFESSNWTWDPVAKAYFWHRFYSHQPDLNFDSPDVQKELLKIIDFWLNLGVDGLRLDAVPYLYEREGTTCENLPETHEFLKKLRRHMDSKFKNRFLLAEANQWPDDAVAYFGSGDECNMAFHFPMMPRMYTAIQMEDRFPLIDILQHTPSIPDACQWVTFLRNHDELTLEMVTDEERDYMYRSYAQDPQMRINLGIRRRLAPLMNSDRRKIELINTLLFTLPGTPVIYYGDEIGMGDNIYLGDRNGVRTLMQWNKEVNAGFSQGNPQKLFLPVIIDYDFNYKMINVEMQLRNEQSLLWWTKRFLTLRKKHKAFSRGSIKFIHLDNYKTFAYIRTYENENILIITNLSRFTQYAELNLSEFEGMSLIELFGDVVFPKISDKLYFLSLNPYSYLIFKIQKLDITVNATSKPYEPPELEVEEKWFEIVEKNKKEILAQSFKDYLYTCRWFKGKSQKIYGIKINEDLMINDKLRFHLLFLEVDFKDKVESYPIFITCITEAEIKLLDNSFENNFPIAYVINKNREKLILIDALFHPEIHECLLRLSTKQKKLKGLHGFLNTKPEFKFNNTNQQFKSYTGKLLSTEQSNTSIMYNKECILKVFRRNDFGENPDVEITQYLTQKKTFKNFPRILSSIEYVSNNRSLTLAILQEYIVHENTAWNFTLERLHLFFDTVLKSPFEPKYNIQSPLHKDLNPEISETEFDLIGNYAELISLLGQRIAELHLALADNSLNENFKPEAFTYFTQRSLCQAINSKYRKLLENLRKKIHEYDAETQELINNMLSVQFQITDLTNHISKQKIHGYKIRCHGDFHLGQILFTGKDFYFIDFEGEPGRPLGERLIKHSPLRDVASILRSFNYAVYNSILEQHYPNANKDNLIKWGLYWCKAVSKLFIKHYVQTINDSGQKLLPDIKQIGPLLKAYMLEKVIYEIEYEMNFRPQWLKIPCLGMLELVNI